MDALGTKRIVILDDGAKRACRIKRGQKLTRYKPPQRAASLLISTALLTAASLLQARADSPAEPRALVHLAQAATSNPGELQGSLEQERRRAEAQARDLAAARRDIEALQILLARARDEFARMRKASENEAAELRKALRQEHEKNLQTHQDAADDPAAELRRAMLRDRAEQVERDLARARGNVEPKSSAAKPNDDAGQSKQAAESALAELRKSLQQERERAGRLEQDLAAARRELETQTARAAKAGAEADQLKQQAAKGGAAELKKSLQQERERTGRLEQELAAARRDIGTQTARAAKASEQAAGEKQAAESAAAELRKSLQQERDKAEALAQEVSAAHTKLSAYEARVHETSDEATGLNQAAESALAELRKSLQQERERAGRLEQDFAAARRDLETQTARAAKAGAEADQLKQQAAKGGAAELKKSLQQERERTGRLEQELAAARRDIGTQTARAAKASEQAAGEKQAAESATAELRESLQQERDKAEALAQEVSAARTKLSAYEAQAHETSDEATGLNQAAESALAELRKSLQQERERAGRLEQDFAAARREVETQTARAAKAGAEADQLKQQAAKGGAAELKKSLQQERERAGRLEQDLAAARRTQTARVARASEQAASEKQAAESATAELRKSLQQERDKAEALAQEVSAARTKLSAYEAQARKTSDEATDHNQAAEGIPELQNSLGQERERARQLERDLAGARADVEKQATLAVKAGEEATREKQLGESAAAELHKSLQQEHDKAEALTQEVAAVRASLSAYEAETRKARDEAADLKRAADGAAELKTSLNQERERAGQLEQALAAARRDVETQTALAATAGETAARDKQAAEGDSTKLQKLLQQEHDRAEALTQEVSAARTSLSAYEAEARKARGEAADLKQAADGAAELKKSLDQERERAGQLEQALAAARREVETQTALAATASETAARNKQAAEGDSTKLQELLQQEHDRAEGLAQEVSAARAGVFAHEAEARKARDEAAADLKRAAEGTAELQKSLQRERERAGLLERELATARRDVETQKALATKAGEAAARDKQVAESVSTELKTSLQRERKRAGRLEQELTVALDNVETQKALAAKATAEAAREKQAGENGSAQLRQFLQQERDRVARLKRQLAFARSTKDAPAAPVATASAAGQLTPDRRREADTAGLVMTIGEIRGGAQPVDSAEVVRLVARANLLLGQGDIGSARIVLERAAETGSAQASFALAETYDPLILPKWGTYGTQGDAMKAQALYAKAEAGGIREAKERFDALRR